MSNMAADSYAEMIKKYNHVSDALFSDTLYSGDAANLAGQDAGALAILVLETYSGVKGATAVARGVSDISKRVVKHIDSRMTRSVEDIEIPDLSRVTGHNPVEFSQVGSKGDWDKLVNKNLKPNTAYQLDNGHTYITDASGRVNHVEADLTGVTADRNGYQQRVVGNSGEINDQGGHLIAATLGGAGDRINLVPMDKVLNNGAYRAMERNLQRAINEGKIVSVRIDVSYSAGGGTRPNGIRVNYTIDGVSHTDRFRQ
jgi:hypothetical protein